MPDHMRYLRQLGLMLVFFILTMILYVGAYFALIEPLEASNGLMIPWYRVYGDAGYRSDRICERFFEPIHRLDRRLRPGVWQGEWGSPLNDRPPDDAHLD